MPMLVKVFVLMSLNFLFEVLGFVGFDVGLFCVIGDVVGRG